MFSRLNNRSRPTRPNRTGKKPSPSSALGPPDPFPEFEFVLRSDGAFVLRSDGSKVERIA